MRDPVSEEVNGIPDDDPGDILWPPYARAPIYMCTLKGVYTDTHTHTLTYKQTSENKRVIGSYQQMLFRGCLVQIQHQRLVSLL